MSRVLFDARSKISQVGTIIKQKRYANAIKSLFDGVQFMVQEQLLASEKSEFADLIRNAVADIRASKEIAQLFPLQLDYKPGQEIELLNTLKMMLEALEAVQIDSVAEAYQIWEEKNKELFKQGCLELAKNEATKAKRIFDDLLQRSPTDVLLYVEISEAYEKEGLLEEALFFLEKALTLDPNAVYIKNKLGILLRRLKRYDQSEVAFEKALEITPDDPYLHFNIGRLYVDWHKWQEAYNAALNALNLDPNFDEATKLKNYAQERL